MLKMLLAKHGIQSDLAHDGVQAVEKVNKSRANADQSPPAGSVPGAGASQQASSSSPLFSYSVIFMDHTMPNKVWYSSTFVCQLFST
jgi:CheY-like chemotaxis protein